MFSTWDSVINRYNQVRTACLNALISRRPLLGAPWLCVNVSPRSLRYDWMIAWTLKGLRWHLMTYLSLHTAQSGISQGSQGHQTGRCGSVREQILWSAERRRRRLGMRSARCQWVLVPQNCRCLVGHLGSGGASPRVPDRSKWADIWLRSQSDCYNFWEIKGAVFWHG